MNPLIKNEEPQWIELGGGQRRKIRAYNENAMLVEVGFDTGAVGAAHSHPHTQISYVLDGEFTYTIEGNTRTMKKGDSIVVDGGKVTRLHLRESGHAAGYLHPHARGFRQVTLAAFRRLRARGLHSYRKAYMRRNTIMDMMEQLSRIGHCAGYRHQ